MILLRILEHDLHKTREGVAAIPAVVETPAKPSHLPAVISTSRGKFVPIRWITKPNQKLGGLVPLQGNGIVAGVFQYDSDRLDDLIGDMFDAALNLASEEEWPNVFTGPAAAARAFEYVQKSSGLKSQPHVCLFPSSWKPAAVKKWFGKDAIDNGKFQKSCRLVTAKVNFPVFLSRPDMVGVFTQFVGGHTSILLHNVKAGIGLCPMRS